MSSGQTDKDSPSAAQAATATADLDERRANLTGKFKCKTCCVAFNSKNSIDKHRRSKEHKQNESDLQKAREVELKEKEYKTKAEERKN